LSFDDRTTDFPEGDTDRCVDTLVAWSVDHAVDDTGPGAAQALATAICHGTKVAVARGDGANVLDVMLVVDGPTHNRQVVTLSVIEGSLDTLDFMLSSWRQIVLALSIAGFAGVFAYFLRLGTYRAYVEASGRASTDGLSGLMRREEFLTIFEHAMRQIQGGTGFASLLIIDIDHFKSINDRFGHAAGDEVIRQVGHLIGSTLRGGDSVGRTGGEEFMVLLPSLPKYVAGEVADRLRKRMAANAFTFGGQTFFVTISVGVASVMPSDSVQSVSERADRRLYQAKRKGRNCVIWEDDDNHDF
ncbi:MAG: GGDEF domain-containing protein, partial [Zavarzinia sp.]|nr:GGDEF domain-containing protein [Zavarzinia sp.]